MGWHDGLWWTLLVLGTAPAWGTLIWFLNELYIRPLLIPKAEIERMADVLRLSHPANPAEAAFTEEQNAWYRGETYQQGKWRRIRKLLMRSN